MLFNSPTFLLGFLPIALVGFFLLGRLRQPIYAIIWLTAVSLVFYGWSSPVYLVLLLGSILVNFLIGRSLARHRSSSLLVVGIAANLALLGYFKYMAFFVTALDEATGLGLPIPTIVLPLAISFFTFQQIAYLSDAYAGVAEEPSFSNYCMFITLFPHLIAGPITHHREMLPQFKRPQVYRPQSRMLALGTTMFLIGLFKKCILADTIALWSTPIFDAATNGEPLQFLDCWGGALAYLLQLYFDFSGYSDMAVGLGLLFNIRFPFNFASPLQARNIVDFWARWHISLTRFVTSYLYTPLTMHITRRRLELGKPLPKRGRMSLGAFVDLILVPTLFAMVLIGFWHGAGWQFGLFGLLHGFYLVTNHGWRALKAHWGWPIDSDRLVFLVPAVLLTNVCAVVATVLFRSPDLHVAGTIYAGMLDLGSLHAHGTELVNMHLVGLEVLLLGVAWFMPNSQAWLRCYETGIGPFTHTGVEKSATRLLGVLTWRPTAGFAVLMGCAGFFAVAHALSAAPTEFLYFRF